MRDPNQDNWQTWQPNPVDRSQYPINPYEQQPPYTQPLQEPQRIYRPDMPPQYQQPPTMMPHFQYYRQTRITYKRRFPLRAWLNVLVPLFIAAVIVALLIVKFEVVIIGMLLFGVGYAAFETLKREMRR